MIIPILIATTTVSLISFVGLLFMSENIKKYLHYFISIAAGALLSAAFFDLIPEGLEHLEEMGVHLHESIVFVLVGILFFFFIERFIHWHHCGVGHSHSHTKPVGFLILFGDFVHNFIDGVLIAGAFLLDVRIGIATTVGMILHEIPQEVGDFSVLLHSGYTKAKALMNNFYSALGSIIGGVLGYFAFESFEHIIPYVVLIAAGGFIYIALTDIVPALHEHKHDKKQILIETGVFIVSMVAFYLLFMGHSH